MINLRTIAGIHITVLTAASLYVVYNINNRHARVAHCVVYCFVMAWPSQWKFIAESCSIVVFVDNFVLVYYYVHMLVCTIMRICWCAHLCSRVGVHIYVDMLACTFMCMCWCAHLCAYVSVHIYAHVLVCIFMCICWRAHLCACVGVHIYVHMLVFVFMCI